MHIRLALALCCALAVTAIRVPGDADDLDVNSARSLLATCSYSPPRSRDLVILNWGNKGFNIFGHKKSRADGGKFKTITGVADFATCGKKCVQEKLTAKYPKRCETFIYFPAKKTCTFSNFVVPEFPEEDKTGVPRWCPDSAAQSGYIVDKDL